MTDQNAEGGTHRTTERNTETTTMTDSKNGDEESEYQTLADLVGEGWVSAEREAIEPPLFRWTVGGVSLALSGDGSGDGKPISRQREGATTVTKYLIRPDYEYVVEVDVDGHDPSGPYRVRVTEHSGGPQ